MNEPSRRLVALRYAVLPIAGALAGCGIDLPTGIVLTPTGGAPASDTVTIAFRNHATTDAVDVQFYASNAVLNDVALELFADVNKVQSNIGVAGTGIIEPGEGDVITLPCADDLTIGTAGGRFLDNETGAVRGQGVMRWAEERPLGLCGAVVRIDFSVTGANFDTSIRVLDLSDIQFPDSP